jgi:3-dehydroquinate dehydratase-2
MKNQAKSSKNMLLCGLMKKVGVLHGPNLNLLGSREPLLYGSMSLEKLNTHLQSRAARANLSLWTLQRNGEGDLIEAIHDAYRDNTDYLIINPAAYTHTSIALRDALLAVQIPFIEVHCSNIYARETFRHCSYFSDIAEGVISGLGTQGYLLALDAIIEKERVIIDGHS